MPTMTPPARTFEQVAAEASPESLRGFVRLARRSLARRPSRSVERALRIARRELLARTA
jgi:hypothetical protein